MVNAGNGIAANIRKITRITKVNSARWRSTLSWSISLNFQKICLTWYQYTNFTNDTNFLTEPPAFSIAVLALWESKQFSIINFLELAVTNILTLGNRPLTTWSKFLAIRLAGLTVSPSANFFPKYQYLKSPVFFKTPVDIFATASQFGQFLIKSRISGLTLWPARAVWPLPPRPEVLPSATAAADSHGAFVGVDSFKIVKLHGFG